MRFLPSFHGLTQPRRMASLLVLGGIGALTSTSGAYRGVAATTCTAAGSAQGGGGPVPRGHTYKPRDGDYTHPPSHLRLKQVVVIARHGDRAPIARNIGKVIKDSKETQDLWQSKLPPAKDLEAWATAYPPAVPLRPLDHDEHPYSQLTVRGAQELRALGTHLRKRYVDQLKFLPDKIHDHKADTTTPPILYARATNIRRTQQSAQNLLLGLYPDGSLPIEVRPTHEETLYPNADRKCGRQEEIITELRKKHFNLTPEEVTWLQALTTDAKARLGLEVFVPWNQVREVLTCMVVHGVPLPTGVDEKFVDEICVVAAKQWSSWFNNEEFARLGIGPFLAQLVEAMEQRVAGESPHHVLVYAGHDSTIVPVLAALGIYDDIWPPYASNVVCEVACCQKTGDHFVRTLYNDEERRLAAGTQPVWCKMADFVGMLKKLVPTDFEKECQCKNTDGQEAMGKEDGIGSSIK